MKREWPSRLEIPNTTEDHHILAPLSPPIETRSTVSRTQPTPIWAIHRGSTSRPGCNYKPDAAGLLERELGCRGYCCSPIARGVNTDAYQPLEQARSAEALAADYILLRLPHEVEGLFGDWLAVHLPDQAGRIMNHLRDCRGGKAYDSRFGTRMYGEGVFADLNARRFEQSVKRLGFPGLPQPECELFRPPVRKSAQLDLF